MKESLVLIRRTYNDGEYPNSGIVGAVMTALDSVAIQALWEVWRKSYPQPDADSEFVEWLVEKKYGVKEVAFEIADV